jgi:amidase
MSLPWHYSAHQLARLIRSRQLSAVEVIESHLERISAVNPVVNAVTTLLADSARQGAEDTDRRLNQGEVLGPLAGVPFTVKENIDIAGSATTYGIPALAHAIAPADAPTVRRLRQAGGIPIGQTNLPDLSVRFHTFSQLYGHTINPWDTARTPGGSSGGEGVALATGMSPLGLGNDAGGSVRVPALFAGITALKPTVGRFPADASVGPRDLTLSSQLFPVTGPLARTVGDLRLALEIMNGPDPRDPRVVPAPIRGVPLPRPLRVAVCPDPGQMGSSDSAQEAVLKAANLLSAAGYEVVELDVPRMNEALDAYEHLIMTEFNLSLPILQRLLNEDGQRYIQYAMALRGPVDLPQYIAYTATRLSLQRDWATFMEQYPLILGPVYAAEVPPVGYNAFSLEAHREVAAAMRLCKASTLVGLPAVAVPTGVVGGRPQGVQVIGQAYREDLCLEAAEFIEQAVGPLTPINPCLLNCSGK